MFTGHQGLSFIPKAQILNQYLLSSPKTMLEWGSRGGSPAYAEDKKPRKKETDPERGTK